MDRIIPVLIDIKNVVDYVFLNSWSLADLMGSIGSILYEDDKKDANNPNAHPGIHHYMIGRAMIWAGDILKEITR